MPLRDQILTTPSSPAVRRSVPLGLHRAHSTAPRCASTLFSMRPDRDIKINFPRNTTQCFLSVKTAVKATITSLCTIWRAESENIGSRSFLAALRRLGKPVHVCGEDVFWQLHERRRFVVDHVPFEDLQKYHTWLNILHIHDRARKWKRVEFWGIYLVIVTARNHFVRRGPSRAADQVRMYDALRKHVCKQYTISQSIHIFP